MDMELQEELAMGVGLGVQEEQLKYIVYFVQGQYWHFLAICALLCAVPCCLVVPPPLPAPAAAPPAPAARFIHRFTVLACLCALQKKAIAQKPNLTHSTGLAHGFVCVWMWAMVMEAKAT